MTYRTARPHPLRPTAWLGGAAIGLLLLCIGGGGLAASRGIAAGPRVDAVFGPYHLLSRSGEFPDCHPLSSGCSAGAIGLRRSYYTIWAVTVVEVPVAGGVRQDYGGWRLLTLPLNE